MQRIRHLADKFDVEPLSLEQIDWLCVLTREWQVLADVASADLILWLPTRGGRFVSVALCRSTTASTLHVDDPLGLYASADKQELLREALDTCKPVDKGQVQWAGLYSVETAYVPVSDGKNCIAVLSIDSNVASPTRHSSPQWWTLSVAEVLGQMISRGEFPFRKDPCQAGHDVPRVPDGTILIDKNGRVLQISPNANSTMRRLKIRNSLVGRSLKQELDEARKGELETNEALAVVAMGRAPWQVDVESAGNIVSMRSIPLRQHGSHVGALVLVRDITDMRRTEQKLMTRDATIREIHHRVKNNLQSVSALLRIQERRSESGEAQKALRNAWRRVESIAAVHEALSHNIDGTVDFDEFAQNIMNMAVRVTPAGPDVRVHVEGKFGLLDADRASALATVLAELIANSIEHGYAYEGGHIYVKVNREEELLSVAVEDEGAGIGEGPVEPGLGMHIIKGMVKGELGGTVKWEPREGGGTVVEVRCRPKVPLN